MGPLPDRDIIEEYGVLDDGPIQHHHPGKEDGVIHPPAADHRAGSQHGIDEDPLGAREAGDGARRRILTLGGEDIPIRLVEVQGRIVLQQGHVGRIVGIDASQIIPITVRGNPAALPAETVDAHLNPRGEPGHRLGEGQGIGGGHLLRRLQEVEQKIPFEEIHAHGGATATGGGLRQGPQPPHPILARQVEDHLGRRPPLRPPAGDGDGGPPLAVKADQLGIVHAVDQIAIQGQDIVLGVALDQKAVLTHGAEEAAVPLGPLPHLRRDGGDVFPEFGMKNRPAVPQVLLQGMGLPLDQDQDLAQAGMKTIGQGEVDDAKFAAEGDGGLGPMLGQGGQGIVLARGLDDGQCLSGHGSPGGSGMGMRLGRQRHANFTPSGTARDSG